MLARDESARQRAMFDPHRAATRALRSLRIRTGNKVKGIDSESVRELTSIASKFQSFIS